MWEFDLQAGSPVVEINLFTLVFGFDFDPGDAVLEIDLGSGFEFDLNPKSASIEIGPFTGKVFSFDLAAKMPKQIVLDLLRGWDLDVGAGAADVEFGVYHQFDIDLEITAAMPDEIISDWVPILEDVFTAWAIGSMGFGHSQYTNFPFNSIGVFGGKLYATGPDGLSLLEGGDDDGANIAASMAWNASDYGITERKRVEYLTAFVRTGGTLKMTVVYDEARSYTHSLSDRDGQPGAHRKRITLGKGDRGGVVQLKIANQNGESFTLRQVDVPIVKLGR